MPGTNCWWPINTKQVVVVAARGTKKSAAAAILSDVSIDRGVDKPQHYSKIELH
jgi:hypothetical protein